MRKQMKAAALVLGALIIVSGCGQAKSGSASVSPKSVTTAAPSPSATPKTVAPLSEQQIQVQAYFGDSTGTKLVQKTVPIRYTTDNSKYLSALNALKTSVDPQAVPLFKNFTFKLPELKDGTLTVDLSFTPEGQLGSNGEDLILSALQQTLFQFNEVKAINILVDGQAKDSLMGHKELLHPIKRS